MPDPDATPAPEGSPPPAPSSPCRYLRNKGMYVYTDGYDPNGHGDYDNTIFWCLRSMKGFGPDQDPADRDACCDSGRSCYEPN